MGSGTQLFATGGTSWSVKNDTKYECISKVNVPGHSSQSMSINFNECIWLLVEFGLSQQN